MQNNPKYEGASVDNESTPVTEENETMVSPQPALNPDASQAVQSQVPWHTFLKSAHDQAIKERIALEFEEIVHLQGMDGYCVLTLFEPEDSIDAYDLDQIFNALSEKNADRSKDVLLLLLSRGGSIEPAYQISKLCRSFAKRKFVAIVPRHAKSAATLIAIGADEIHMGPLGQLGPIDPQLDGLPALGVSQALRTIASAAQSYPGSAEMFAKYLHSVLTVEQIGYCDRISESAVQYATRLLSTKPSLAGERAERVAKELVHEYKDHGFVIDLEEAKMHLGSEWVKTGTPELAFAETIYSKFEIVNLLLGVICSKRMMIAGSMTLPSSILVRIDKKRR